MKQIKLIVLVILMILLYGCNKAAVNQVSFEIYLVSGEFPSAEDIDIDKLTLEKTPVLTLNDIRKYYWDEQAFVTKQDFLTEQIMAQTNQSVPVGGLPYVVVVNGERIYIGKFWTAISSVSPYSPSILVNWATGADFEKYDLQPDQHLYAIYWNNDDPGAKEIVFDERIYKALEQSNLLSGNNTAD